MKIAYYEENDYHTEIMGTFLEYYSTAGTDIVVYNSSDKSSTVTYFKSFCKYELRPSDHLIKEYHMYDKILIGSSADSVELFAGITNIDYDKFIFVCHAPTDIKSIYKHVIVLTPLNLIPTKPNVKYILPIHGYITNIPHRTKNILTIIGRFKDANRDTNDLVKLINEYNNLDFIVHIFTRAQKFVPESLIKLSKEYPNKLKIFLKVSSDRLDSYLKESKYILPLVSKNSWYHKDRLSGNIALAYNYNVPLIIDQKLNDIYGINNCVVYQKSLCEIIDRVVQMTDSEYRIMLSNFLDDKLKIIKNNKLILKSL